MTITDPPAIESRPFNLVADFQLTGDQPQAVDKIVEALERKADAVFADVRAVMLEATAYDAEPEVEQLRAELLTVDLVDAVDPETTDEGFTSPQVSLPEFRQRVGDFLGGTELNRCLESMFEEPASAASMRR